MRVISPILLLKVALIPAKFTFSQRTILGRYPDFQGNHAIAQVAVLYCIEIPGFQGNHAIAQVALLYCKEISRFSV